MAKAQTVTFLSNFSEHELVRVPRNETPTAGLNWITTTAAVKYRFLPSVDESGKMVGRCDVVVGADKLIDGNGWLAPGEEQGIERDSVTALRAHREFGRDFWLQPTPAAQVRKLIRTAIANLDADALQSLLDVEQADHKRADLLTEIQDGLDLVREQIAGIQARQAAEAAEAEAQAAAPKAKAKPKAPAAV